MYTLSTYRSRRVRPCRPVVENKRIILKILQKRTQKANNASVFIELCQQPRDFPAACFTSADSGNAIGVRRSCDHVVVPRRVEIPRESFVIACGYTCRCELGLGYYLPFLPLFHSITYYIGVRQ